MTTLIFDTILSGHHLEYLHHYYLGAIEKTSEQFVFVVPMKFESVRNQYEWNKTDNVTFCYIDPVYDSRLAEPNFYKLGWNVSKILKDYVLEIKPDRVLLTMLMQFIPFIIFLLPKKVRVRGIMYKIYLYEQGKMSFMRLAAEKFRFWLASYSGIIEKIFVLNDEESAGKFNKIYKTDKFSFLPDPIPQVTPSEIQDIRERLDISKEEKVYLHFGGLDKRKGTLDILNAIISASKDSLKSRTFIFAGKQNATLKNEFNSLLGKAREKARILVYDEFCSYEFLYSLCKSSDVILIPYHITNLSSGVLGYAALFGKPVIGPDNGLLSDLIEKYRLGTITAIPLKCESLYSDGISVIENNNKYIRQNSLGNFIRMVLA